LSLLIPKSTSKNFVAADFEIIPKLWRCRFRIQQQKTMPLLIQKSAAMMESFWLIFFGCLQFDMTPMNDYFPDEYFLLL